MRAVPTIPDDRDRRHLSSDIELRTVRADGDGDPRSVIEGLAAVFDQETVIGVAPWGFREVIRRGAFTRAIREDDVRGLFNHDPNLILGRNRSGRLRLSEDDSGLKYSIDPPKTSYAVDLLDSIGRKDVTGSSFSFRVKKETWTEPEEGSAELPLREIHEAELFDVAPVTFPAYEVTSVAVSARTHHEAVDEAKQRAQADAAAREAGLSEARRRALALELETSNL